MRGVVAPQREHVGELAGARRKLLRQDDAIDLVPEACEIDNGLGVLRVVDPRRASGRRERDSCLGDEGD